MMRVLLTALVVLVLLLALVGCIGYFAELLIEDRIAQAPTNAARPTAPPAQPAERALCSVTWCPSNPGDVTKAWKGFILCDVHYADLHNTGVLAIADRTCDHLADEAEQYLRSHGGGA